MQRLLRASRPKREWEEKQKQLQNWEGKGTYRSLIHFSPEDSVFYSTLSDRGKQNFRRMRLFERTPLTDQDRQLHTVDGQWYERLRGETRFRPIPGITKEELRSGNWRRRDSVAANPPDNSYDIVLDLRNHADYEFVEPRVDSLIATSDSGFYETVVDRSTLIELIKHGIQYRRTDGPLMNPRDSTGSHGPRRTDPDRKSESRLPGREGRDEIFSTDFEGAWPGPWWHIPPPYIISSGSTSMVSLIVEGSLKRGSDSSHSRSILTNLTTWRVLTKRCRR